MIQHDIPLPRLLDASGGTERRIRPESVTLSLNITPLSYATIQLPAGETIPARSYVELYTCMGSAGIYRVRSPQDAYGEDIATAELEHAIVEVGDYIIKAKYNQMMAASTAMQTVFSHYGGTKWQLGSVSAMGTSQIGVQQDHTRVLEAMLALLEQVPNCMMAFDFSTTPWTVSVVQKGATVTAEGRLSRNVNAARIIYDDTELCTRVYYEIPATTDAGTQNFNAFDQNKVNSAGSYVKYNNKLYMLPNGHEYGVTWANTQSTLMSDEPTTAWTYMDADAATISTYGIIERELTSGFEYTQAEAEAMASEYLRKHKIPRVSVEISGEELSSVTGEALDAFTVGKKFRLALPDYGITVEDYVTALSWSNVYDAPEDIVINLADEEDTAVTFIHDLDAKGGGGGGGGGKKKQEDQWKEYRTNFQMTDYFVDLYAQRVSKTEDILQQAGLYLTSGGALLYAHDNENMVQGKIDVQADRIGLVVEGTGANASIKAAQIWGSIDTELRQSQVTISADIIDIDGLLAAFESESITCGNINCQGTLTVDQDIITEGNVDGFTGSFGLLTVDEEEVSWQSKKVSTITWGTRQYFLYSTTDTGRTANGSVRAYPITAHTDETIHYLGKAST